MRVCFISGEYKPGICGISDYIKLLTQKFEHLGHEVEKYHINQASTLPKVFEDLPTADVYSVQFAPYFFSPSGLSGVRLHNLANLLLEKTVHVNFHEIWIGAYRSASWKERFTGWRQRREILKFLESLNPIAVTCSNSAILDRLDNQGINARYLYMFGNIPFCECSSGSRPEFLQVVIFGTPYENFPYDELAARLKQISELLKKKVHIRVVGLQRNSLGLNKIQKFSKDLNFVFSESGELTSNSISKELQESDIGISTTPFDIIGKSGAATAILEHGLPIIGFDDGDTPNEKLFVFEEFENQIFLLNDRKMNERLILFLKRNRKTFFDGVAHTANEMLGFLN